MTVIEISDAVIQLEALVDRAVAGEVIYLARDGKILARMVAVTEAEKGLSEAKTKA